MNSQNSFPPLIIFSFPKDSGGLEFFEEAATALRMNSEVSLLRWVSIFDFQSPIFTSISEGLPRRLKEMRDMNSSNDCLNKDLSFQ
jgi:hypothetical protein